MDDFLPSATPDSTRVPDPEIIFWEYMNLKPPSVDLPILTFLSYLLRISAQSVQWHDRQRSECLSSTCMLILAPAGYPDRRDTLISELQELTGTAAG